MRYLCLGQELAAVTTPVCEQGQRDSCHPCLADPLPAWLTQ